MKVIFWGTRGSLPAPLCAEEVQAKINAVVSLIKKSDIEDADSRQKFLSSLPKSLYGTAGGNTSCVQVVSGEGRSIILDAGTGIRALSEKSAPSEGKKYAILLSHLHWDHIQGFPFFSPAYDKDSVIDIYSPFPEAAESFAHQMRPPFFPVKFSSIKHRINFWTITPGTEFEAAGLAVNCCKMSHPGSSYSYSVREGKKKFVYATDMELYIESGLRDENVKKVFCGADAAVLDSQYTLGEAVEKMNWGHSPFAYAVDFAAEMGIKCIYLFHHDPSHSDRKLESILHAARWYEKYIAAAGLAVNLAVEGAEIEL